MKIVIIGGGLAGLITGWFFKRKNYEVKIVTDKIGGWQNLNQTYKFGPRLIKVDNYSTNLLDFFNLCNSSKIVKIAYEYKDGLIKDVLDKQFKNEYSLRTREHIENTHLSNSQNNFKAFSIDYDHVLQMISKYLENNFVISKAKKIFENKLFLENDEILHFDKIVSTIPLNILFKILNLNSQYDFTAFHTSFVLCSLKKGIKISNDYEYIYSIYDSLFHRINLIEDNLFVNEYKGKFEINRNRSNRFNFLKTATVPFAQIKKSINLKEVADIQLIGRFAQWKHGIVINDILKDLNEEKRWSF